MDSVKLSKAPKLDVVLAGDFKTSSPDLVLRLAVLERAIRDIIDYNQSKRCADAAVKRQAWAWFQSNTRNQGWFTFVEVCEDLGLNYEAVRRKIFSEIETPAFLSRFEKTQGVSICDLRKRRPRAPVRYHKKDALGRGPKRRLTLEASGLKTSDLLVCEPSSDAE